jgi:hypothetical protein
MRCQQAVAIIIAGSPLAAVSGNKGKRHASRKRQKPARIAFGQADRDGCVE